MKKKPKVAFVCVHNSCRSQIAEALGKHFASDTFDSYSGGTETKPQINQDAVRLVRKHYDIDMEETQESKLITELPDIDILIKMGCNVVCPHLNNAYEEDWGFEDPSGQSDDVFEATISKIEEKVKELKHKIENNQILAD